MKTAFLVLNHRPPAQLVRLLTTVRSQLPDAPIVVHHDVFHGKFPAALIEPIGNVHILESGRHLTWGDFSLVEACSWSLTWMRENLDFDWVVLLSGQDYPIKPLAGLVDDLTRDGAEAVFSATPINEMPTLTRILLRRRYYFQYRPVLAPATSSSANCLPRRVRKALDWSTWNITRALNNLQPFFKIYRLGQRTPYRFGRRANKTPFDKNWRCWYSSQWFALSRPALEYALDYLTAHPDYADYYRATLVPDESMLATIIFNSPNFAVANRSVTYTRWANKRSPHPDTFVLADLAELLAAPQYFARKFDMSEDANILDALDKFIGEHTYDMRHS